MTQSVLVLARSAAVVIVMALAATGCIGGPGATGLIHVVNLGTTDVSFHWQSPGILGTDILGGSGTEPVSGCSLYSRGFAPGKQQITISTSLTTNDFTLVAPSAGQSDLWVVVGRDGTVEETTETKAPPSPFCGG